VSDACRRIVWVDGRIVSADESVVPVDDSAFAEGRGCYTSVRIAAGTPRFPDRHLRRLQLGAEALRLGEVTAAEVDRALAETAAAAFVDGEGVVRLQLSRSPGGRPRLVGIPRGLGADRNEWSAVTSPLHHAGEVLPGGHKLTNRVVLGMAAELATEAGADEALLFDFEGRLVEGARSNVVVVSPEGFPSTPAPGLGAVAGIALQVAVERFPEIANGEIPRTELDGAHEIIALNSVRGARPITRLDGRPVGSGKIGPWARKLATAIASE